MMEGSTLVTLAPAAHLYPSLTTAARSRLCGGSLRTFNGKPRVVGVAEATSFFCFEPAQTKLLSAAMTRSLLLLAILLVIAGPIFPQQTVAPDVQLLTRTST